MPRPVMVPARRADLAALGYGDFGIEPVTTAAVISAVPGVVSTVSSWFGGGGTKPPPGDLAGKIKLANQYQTFTLVKPATVYYTAPNGTTETKVLAAGSHICNGPTPNPAGSFNTDPQKGANKACYVDAVAQAAIPSVIALPTGTGVATGGGTTPTPQDFVTNLLTMFSTPANNPVATPMQPQMQQAGMFGFGGNTLVTLALVGLGAFALSKIVGGGGRRRR